MFIKLISYSRYIQWTLSFYFTLSRRTGGRIARRELKYWAFSSAGPDFDWTAIDPEKAAHQAASVYWE
ncbi:hypothetical protein OMR58_02520 [Erwinia sp. INIA-01]|uniref:hypothetical protein n=1 Tax=Erwinia sp. INIA01 TaxID=2991500 RepID=UPI00222456C6|nr:hypothetical protein [Erwinia sp. INIA01]MCW1873318.1 hypothetical protein [Erwinia sp. INIA01]